MSKKDLDKLFQEKFKDFREIPDERVWESIENSLDQRRRRRRVIPIWWKLGGAAAILAIALLAINPFENTEIPESNISDVENSESPAMKDQGEEPVLKIDNEVLPTEDALTEQQGKEGIPKTDQEEDIISEENLNGLAGTPERGDQGDEQFEEMKGIEQDNALTTAEDSKSEIEEDVSDKIPGEESEALADNRKDAFDAENEKNNTDDLTRPDLQDQIISKDLTKDQNTAIAEETTESEIEDSDGKKSIFDEINKQEEEDALAQASEESKWSVGPSVAPVYFNSFGEGSPIHSSFASNSKSGNVNLSYGIGVSYDISKKLKVRSGIHKVDYGYDTNDITFSSSLVASTSTQITNINYTSTSRNLVVESGNEREAVQEFVANDIIAQSPSRNGRMVQEFGYLEIPMELNYALLDRKLNIDIIGGFSSLFLIDNSVILESGGTATEMGEANNLNDVNFSTNVGLGINYELTDKMKVHLEPMFKYQMNTFSQTEGSFEPYSIGVYTGLSFKF